MNCNCCGMPSAKVICDKCTTEYEKMKRIVTGKPPLGLVPKKIWMQTRVVEILEATNRYIQDNREIPIEWIEEYNEIIKTIKKGKENNNGLV
jgi:hypothetical protein